MFRAVRTAPLALRPQYVLLSQRCWKKGPGPQTCSEHLLREETAGGVGVARMQTAAFLPPAMCTAGKEKQARTQGRETQCRESKWRREVKAQRLVFSKPSKSISSYLTSLFQERSRTASECPSAEEFCNNYLITFGIKAYPQ